MENGKMVKLGVTKKGKDLATYTTNNLKPSMQCTTAASKARSVLGMIRQHFKNIDAEEFRILYDSYIRPHMEYCVQVWPPCLTKEHRMSGEGSDECIKNGEGSKEDGV